MNNRSPSSKRCIDALKFVGEDSELNIGEEISRLRNKSESLAREVFANLSPMQKVQLSRHPNRPYTLDYIAAVQRLSGASRRSRYGETARGGLARLTASVVVVGHQKGRNTKENMKRNFGMRNPEGYRKALRLMYLAERFGLPIVTLIDTPGAYPGIEAEERGQSEAIARNLSMATSACRS